MKATPRACTFGISVAAARLTSSSEAPTRRSWKAATSPASSARSSSDENAAGSIAGGVIR
jgi:hypothetical protein